MADLNKFFPDHDMPKTSEAIKAMQREREIQRDVLEDSDIIVDTGLHDKDGYRLVFRSLDLGAEGSGFDIYPAHSDLVSNALSSPHAFSLEHFSEVMNDPSLAKYRTQFIDAIHKSEEIPAEQKPGILMRLGEQHASAAPSVAYENTASV